MRSFEGVRVVVLEARSKKEKGPDLEGACFYEPGFLMEEGGPDECSKDFGRMFIGGRS